MSVKKKIAKQFQHIEIGSVFNITTGKQPQDDKIDYHKTSDEQGTSKRGAIIEVPLDSIVMVEVENKIEEPQVKDVYIDIKAEQETPNFDKQKYTMSESPNIYDIKTISDLSKIVTEENYQHLLSDVAEVFIRLVQIKKTIKKQTGEYPKHSILDNFTWIDNGKKGLTKIIINDVEYQLKPIV